MNATSLSATPTYARGRLQLGIAGVGTAVVLALLAIGAGLPDLLFASAGGSFATDLVALLGWTGGLALVTAPAEVLGGHRIPRAFSRAHPSGQAWALRWLRGILVIAPLMAASGATVLAAGRAGGEAAALGTFGLLLVALLLLQARLASWVGGLTRRRVELESVDRELSQLGVEPLPLLVLEGEDEGFTGGLAGLVGGERSVLPASWIQRFQPRALALLLARRSRIASSGLRAAGVTLALVWTLGIFTLASALPGGGLASVAELVTTSLWFSVLSFVGLLVLPVASRAGTRRADADLVAGLSREDRALFEQSLGALDRLQDDEPERSARVESVFHPTPALGSRLRALGTPPGSLAPWHVARVAIYLSIAGMNPLHRLVHCNVGRPELWVFLPADG